MDAEWAVRDVDGDLGHLFRIAQQNFRSRLAEIAATETLSLAHYVALSAFEAVNEATSADLARLLDVTPQAANIMVHRLIERRLLLRQRESAGRSRMLRLSRRGQATLDRLRPLVQDVEQRAFAGLSGPEQRTVRRWLSGVASWSADHEVPTFPRARRANARSV